MVIFGGVELNIATRKQTGRVFLKHVANRKSETLRRVIEHTVLPGTEVWTDDYPSYNFLTAAGYRHFTVNHSVGEVATEEKQGTNSVEGLFSRCKRFLKQTYTRMPTKGDYGLLLAEFVWRTTALGNYTVPERSW